MVLYRLRSAGCAAAALALLFLGRSAAAQEGAGPPPVVQNITAANTKIELTVNGSRILKLDSPIPRAQVGNPDLLAFTVISENEVQLHAKKAGITSVVLWDNKEEAFTVDVVIVGDVRELEGLLKAQFPTASVKLYPTQSATLILSGYVDRSDHVNTIMRIAEDYYPKVINNMVVGGTQQVLLEVKVMEVSRTQLKQIGFDFANFSGSNFFAQTVSGVLNSNPGTGVFTTAGSLATSGAETVQFGIVSDPSGFVGFLEALKQENLLKVLAEPKLVTVSGRPASYLVGGEMPYPQPTGFGNIAIAFKPFGTQIDFVPIVLGNSTVRLEVRPQVSELDPTLSITVAGTSVPGFRERFVDTGVEMKFGQTLAIAGLLQQRIESEKRGIPYLMDMPYVGAAFRRNRTRINEVELLILVKPELVEAMDCDQVPQCAPGLNSQIPDDCGLYWKGYIETPIQPYGIEGHGPGGPMGPGPRGPGAMGPGAMGPQGGAPSGPLPEQVIPNLEQEGEVPMTQAARQRVRVISDRPVEQAPASSSRRPVHAQPPSGTSAQAGSYNRANPQVRVSDRSANANSAPPGLIGPIGYDVKN